AAAVSALYSLESRVPFVTMSSEMDALLGTFFARLARDRDTLYSLADGDQPGVLARLIQEVIFQGFEPVVSGNVKNHYDPYATPDSVRPFLLPGQDAFKICSFADGTKQAFELASVANGFGFSTAKRGFNG